MVMEPTVAPVTLTDPLATITTEAALHAAVVELAQRLGYRVFWLPDWLYRLAMASLRRQRRRGRVWVPAGYPDLTICGHGRLIVAELKTERGRVTDEQRAWLTALMEAGVEIYTWRPSDWRSGWIEEVLRP